MALPHIAVLDPAAHTPEIDCFNQLALFSKLTLTYHLPALQGLGTLNTSKAPLKGIIVLGSATSVTEPSLWQTHLRQWLKEQWESKIPTLAICYGHQLVAHMWGGEVGFAYPDKRKLDGVRNVGLGPCALWGKTHQTGPLVVSHREVVKTCPQEMQILGKSREFPIEALAHKTLPLWSLQAHPEASRQFLQHNKIEKVDPESFRFGSRLMLGFLEYCEQNA